MAWLSGWSYRKEISITGQSGAGTNYQVDLDIGDSAGGDFHLEGHCTNFPQDIEVTDNDGTTLLKFWIEDITADPLVMSVKVADDLGSNQTIYVYYGKSGATTNSDIGATFIFGDDFTGDLAKWNTYGTATIESEKCKITGTDAWNTNGILGKTNFGKDIIIELNGATSTISGTNTFPCGYTDTFDISHGVNYYIASNNINYWVDGGGVDTGSNTDLTYNDWDLIVTTTGYDMIYNDSSIRSASWTTLSNGTAAAQVYGNGHILYIDYVKVRKYLATAPAFSSAGSEETPPTGVSPTAVFYGPLVGPLGGPI